MSDYFYRKREATVDQQGLLAFYAFTYCNASGCSSFGNGLEKRPKLRFPGFDEPWEHKELLHYLVENTDRNKQLKFGKENVLSVSVGLYALSDLLIGIFLTVNEDT